MWIPKGALGDVASAKAKGITLGEERTTPPIKVLSPIVDAASVAFPQVKIMQGGALLLDLTVSAQEQSLTPLIGRGAGEVVKIPLRRTTDLSETTIQRISAG